MLSAGTSVGVGTVVSGGTVSGGFVSGASLTAGSVCTGFDVSEGDVVSGIVVVSGGVAVSGELEVSGVISDDSVASDVFEDVVKEEVSGFEVDVSEGRESVVETEDVTGGRVESVGKEFVLLLQAANWKRISTQIIADQNEFFTFHHLSL